MKKQFRVKRLAGALAVLLATAPVYAQTTSANLAGRVTSADGAPLVGAQVTNPRPAPGNLRHQRLDFVRIGHDGELNRANVATAFQKRLADTVTSIHQRTVSVQDDRPLEIRRIDAPTVARHFAKCCLPAGAKPAVLVQLSNGR